jgi:DNA-binding XRE family transcriptional regulator
LSQEEAGGLIGVNPFTVLNWEKGRTPPPREPFPESSGS